MPLISALLKRSPRHNQLQADRVCYRERRLLGGSFAELLKEPAGDAGGPREKSPNRQSIAKDFSSWDRRRPAGSFLQITDSGE